MTGVERVVSHADTTPDLSITDHPFRPHRIGDVAIDVCDTCGEHSIWHKPVVPASAREAT